MKGIPVRVDKGRSSYAAQVADAIYDATGGRADDFPKGYHGPAQNIKKMANPYDYARKTEEEKDKYDASTAIASLLSFGAAGGAIAAEKFPLTSTGAKLKAYLASKGLDAPAIATSTYADYKQIELKKGRKPKSQSQFNTAKNLILNLFPTKTAGGGAIVSIGTQFDE